MKPAVVVKDLWWRYPAFSGQLNPYALQGIDLEVGAGEFLAITGPSGAGKTTLCSAITGIIPHALKLTRGQVDRYWRGSVQVLGETVTALAGAGSNAVITGRGVLSPEIGLVMQDPENQFLRMSVLHEIALGLQILQLPAEEIAGRVREALQMVNLEYLWPLAALTHPAELSGGQKQRVALASFLAMRPRVLILDEPTSDLDPVGKREVIAAVRNLKDRYDLTVILVEHSPDVIAAFADRVVLLDQGRICYTAPPATFYSQVEMLQEYGVMVPATARVLVFAGWPREQEMPLAPAAVAEYLVPRLPADPIRVDVNAAPVASAMVGFHQELTQPVPTEIPTSGFLPQTSVSRVAARSAGVLSSGEEIIRVENLEHRYPDGTLSLKGVDLRVDRGEFLALLGANGSGKTTLSKVLNGLYPPARGRVTILGQDIRNKHNRSQLPRYVGYVFQNPEHQIFTRSVFDDVAYGLRHMGLGEEEIKTRVQQALDIVGLTDLAGEDPLFLGKGQKQRLAVASIVAMQPEILIVDEPTTGQDYRMSANIMALLQELNRRGTTIIVITHDMSLVTTYCRRSVVLRDGLVVFDGATRELFREPQLVEAALLYPPRAVQLSWEVRRLRPDWPVLINTREWEQVWSGGLQWQQRMTS